MTKADWLDFFEAINGRSATEEEIAAAFAAGEFQDDAPAVETAPVQEAPVQPAFASAQETPVQEAPAQPAFANAQETPVQEAQPQPTFAGAQEAQQQPTFASAQDAQPQAPFANAQAANLNQPLQVLKLLQYKECQIKQHNHKLVLRMLKLVNKQLLLMVNLFNQVKTFNLSMVKLQLFQHNHQHLRQLSKTTGHGCLMHGVVQLT